MFRCAICCKGIARKRYTSHQYLCDICINQHITQSATIRCPECEENFCEKCKIHHELAKSTKKHEIISIENVLKLPKFVQDITINCPDHEERFFVYCDDHGVPCCAHCLQNVHAGCRNLIPIQKLIQNVKESSFLNDLETTLSDLITNITNIIEDRTANLRDLEEQKTRCKKEIKAHREAINAYIDELEADLFDNLQKTFIKREVEIQNTLKVFELRKSNVCEMQEHVTIVKNIAAEFQSFMAIRELTKSANIAEMDLQHMFIGGSFNWVEICYTPVNTNLVKDNLPSIGKTDVRVDPSKITLKVRKTREAQLIGPSNCPINIESIQLKEKVKSQLPEGKYEFEILDCGFLLDGNMIFSESKSNRLVILDSNGVFIRNLKLVFKPIRFAVVDEKTIAVTTETQVNIVDVKSGVTIQTLKPGTCTTNSVGSIALTDDKQLMVEVFGVGYILLDLKGNVKTRISVKFSDKHFHFPICIKERLYYVDSLNATLYCYDFDGNEVLKFKNKLFKSTMAFTSDKSNILFCSGYNPSNVYVISTDGKSSKEINSNMYLTCASAAHYNINKRELLVITVKGNFILYDVI